MPARPKRAESSKAPATVSRRASPSAPRKASPSSASGSTPAVPAVRETPAARRRRAARIVAELQELYPDATCALVHRNAFELLVATILSAQSTDVTVNRITPVLFERYPDPQALAEAPAAEVEKIIYPTGFFRQKTRSIIGAARAIVEEFGGRVPGTVAELTRLPGVARKTANVVVGTWFGCNEGVIVDTHVGRLARRLALSPNSRNDKDAIRIEQDLMEILPQDKWTFTAHALVWHGRKVCSARKPACEQCRLQKLCPAAFTFD